MPEGAVYVGRPSLWGNTWTWRDAPDWIVPGWDWTDEDLPPAGSARAATREDRAAWAVARYREELEHFGLLSDYAGWVSEEHWRETNGAVIASGATNMAEYVPFALRGKTLVCWCPLDAPCHADVLLELANR